MVKPTTIHVLPRYGQLWSVALQSKGGGGTLIFSSYVGSGPASMYKDVGGRFLFHFS